MAATQPKNPVSTRLFSILLSKAVIRRAITHSATQVNASVAEQFRRDAYILKVLQASAATRNVVRAQLGATVAAAGDDDEATLGQSHFLYLLTTFEMLSDEQKFLFIDAYKATATVAAQGTDMAITPHLVQPGHNPPINVP